MIADVAYRLRLFRRQPGPAGTAVPLLAIVITVLLIVLASWLAARGAAHADPAASMRAE